jgi:hypothetical protein
LKKGEEFGFIYKPKNLEKKSYKKNIKKEDDIFYDTNIERESTYITELFKRIKDYIDGAIIVLNIENYYFEENIKIITKLYKVIEKEIKNYLIILNKIDLLLILILILNHVKEFYLINFQDLKLLI